MVAHSVFVGPPRLAPAGRNHDAILVPGQNLRIGESDLRECFGDLSAVELDLLTLAAGVFAADRAFKRGRREHITRSIALQLAIAEPERLLPHLLELRGVLRLLSHDAWHLELVRDTSRDVPSSAPLIVEQEGATLLFSGGLDSLAAALELMPQANLQLVSHRTPNQNTRRAQEGLIDGLQELGLAGPARQIRVFSKSDELLESHASEESQRTRSFVFLALGAICARRMGHHRILYMAENGQMAIHLPLTLARAGAFSTHTAHPEVLRRMATLLSAVLDYPLEIQNPYLYKTKGEVVALVLERAAHLLPKAESCWMNARLPPERSHCGQCVPCIVRHIAIAANIHNDPTSYSRAVWADDFTSLDPESDARRNVVEVAEFATAMATLSDEEARAQWPELYETQSFDSSRVLAMYRRFADEAMLVFRRYPSIACLLP